MVLVLTTKSLMHLLSAWPRWMAPLAYGGPSWRMYLGWPARAARIWAYKWLCCHASRRAGSFWGRLAFMGKAVCGRFSVDFSALTSGFAWVTSDIRSSWFLIAKMRFAANLYCSRG